MKLTKKNKMLLAALAFFWWQSRKKAAVTSAARAVKQALTEAVTAKNNTATPVPQTDEQADAASAVEKALKSTLGPSAE